jgi:hypothetical protein
MANKWTLRQLLQVINVGLCAAPAYHKAFFILLETSPRPILFACSSPCQFFDLAVNDLYTMIICWHSHHIYKQKVPCSKFLPKRTKREREPLTTGWWLTYLITLFQLQILRSFHPYVPCGLFRWNSVHMNYSTSCLANLISPNLLQFSSV